MLVMKNRFRLRFIYICIAIIISFIAIKVINPFSASQEIRNINIAVKSLNSSEDISENIDFNVEYLNDTTYKLILPKKLNNKTVEKYRVGLINESNNNEIVSNETTNNEIIETNDTANTLSTETVTNNKYNYVELDFSGNEEQLTYELSESIVNSNNINEVLKIEVLYGSTENSEENNNEISNNTVDAGQVQPKSNDVQVEFAGGKGTSAEPYLIKNAAQLVLLSNRVNTHAEDTKNGGYYNTKYYKLIPDENKNVIDMNGIDWQPIGSALNSYTITSDSNLTDNKTFKETVFSGNFNGNGVIIKNLNVKIDSPDKKYNKKYVYGLFGAIYSDSIANKAEIYNVEIDKMTININLSGSLASGGISEQFAIGCIAGHQGRNTKIVNCIVRNSKIINESNFDFNSSENLLCIGGIVGDTSFNPTKSVLAYANPETNTTQGKGVCFVIENCFSDVDISMKETNTSNDKWREININNSNDNLYYQYNIGGIVGRIRGQANFPQKCLYTGTITASRAFIGPIYGCARFNTPGIQANFLSTYIGKDSTNVSIGELYSGLFYDYNIVKDGVTYNFDTKYKNKYKKFDTGIYVDNREKEKNIYVLDNSYMGKVQGVNRGSAVDSKVTALAVFNRYVEKNNLSYKKWYYDYNSETFTFLDQEKITGKIENLGKNKYKIDLNKSLENITYKWKLGNTILSGSSNEILIDPPLDTTKYLTVNIYQNDKVIYSDTVVVYKEEISLKITVSNDENNNKILKAIIVTKNGSIDENDYSFQWYIKGVNGYTEIDNANNASLLITSPLEEAVLKVKATYKHNNELYNLEKEYVNSNTIFVNQSGYLEYSKGNDNNDGTTPDTAVNTLQQAYKLTNNNEKNPEKNIIVIMGTYKPNNTIDRDIFSKPAKIVGNYNEIKDGILYASESMFLKADTIFENITLDGTNANGYDYLFLYCQTHDLTMGKGIKVQNYRKASTTSWALLDDKHPAISIMGGYLNYNNTAGQPIDSKNVCNINIKSGYFGRIIAGGRNENSNHKILGNYDNPFNVNVTIDIQNNNPSASYEKDIGLIVGGQADGSCFMNTKINLINGSVDRILGANLGGGKGDATKEPMDSFFGTTEINISGGTVGDFAGGSLGRGDSLSEFFYGQIKINISGGTVERNAFAGSVGGVIGYSDAKQQTDKHKSYAKEKMIDYSGENKSIDLSKSTVELNISGEAIILDNIYGGSYGYSDYTTNKNIYEYMGDIFGEIKIDISGGTILGNVYGGSQGPLESILEDKLKNKEIEKTCSLANVIGNINMKISDDAKIYGNIYGGGAGVSGYNNIALVVGSKYAVENDNSVKNSIDNEGDNETKKDIEIVVDNVKFEIEPMTVNLENGSVKTASVKGNIYGGGDASNVVGTINVEIRNSNKIVGNVFGGGNSADVGTKDDKGETNVYIHNSTVKGNVFGGGNEGTVYGTTNVNVGIKEELTIIEKTLYAGGKGLDKSTTAVYGESNAKIIGHNTDITEYGNTELGKIEGTVNINFEDFYVNNSKRKYKTMSGINRADNLELKNSFIYLEQGLIDVGNLTIPKDSGMMITEDSQISGNYTGGGTLNIGNGEYLLINGDIKAEPDFTPTKLVVNPKQSEENKPYEVDGSSFSPYIRVRGKDETNGLAFEYGNEQYKLYNFLLNEDKTRYYTNISDPTINTTDKREYIKDGEKYYIDAIYNVDDSENKPRIEIRYYSETGSNTDDRNGLKYDTKNEDYTSTYYIELKEPYIMQSHIDVEKTATKDKKYTSDIINMEEINMMPDEAFTFEVKCAYEMYRKKDNNSNQYVLIDDNKFKSLSRTISICTSEDTSTQKIQIPIGTKVVMITDNNYYLYEVKEEKYSIGLNEFIEITSDKKYPEIENMQDVLINSAENSALKEVLKTEENFRFVMDFSDADTLLNINDYEITFEIYDTISNTDENGNTTQETYMCSKDNTNNMIKLFNRNYSPYITAKREFSYVNSSINLSGKIEIGGLNDKQSDVAQKLKMGISISNSDGSYVPIPIGTEIYINNEKAEIKNQSASSILLKEIPKNGITLGENENNINVKIDFKHVSKANQLKNGRYTIKIDFYKVNSSGLVLGERNVAYQNIPINIWERANDYSIELNLNNIDEKRDDEMQLITSNGNRIVKVLFDKGKLDNGAYVQAKVYKYDGSEYKEYKNILTTTTFYSSNDSTLIFDNNVQNGIYRVVYTLYDENNEELTNTWMNFIVNK